MTSGRRSTAAQPATGAQPAAGGRSAAGGRLRQLSPRAELTVVLLLGAAGSGLVFLAMRQGWAQVRTAVPAPLPASVVTDSGQSLLPYADALVIAALASLAAVLATRGAARRVTGVLLAGLGVAIAAAATAGVSTAAALAAAAQSVGPATGAGAGAAPESATDGSAPAGSVPNVGGFHSHAVLTAAGWQALTVAGAVAIIAAGVLVTWRAARLPVMSSRYDAPAARPSPARRSADLAGSDAPPNPDSLASPDALADPDTQFADPDDEGPDSASMWESLSRGEDPTSAARRPA
ncbi:MAG TPA: Trp biosynthesis-associated membrane protein [Streptosporangiaceae bacterium]|nr:Trp biosynthesis-associated membrane protein [Streptosporangiaceae bacterium]